LKKERDVLHKKREWRERDVLQKKREGMRWEKMHFIVILILPCQVLKK